MTPQEQKQYDKECLLERAAIIEFCGNVPRVEAERMAIEQFNKQRSAERAANQKQG